MERLLVRSRSLPANYEVLIGRDLLPAIGEQSRRWLGVDTRKALLISQAAVSRKYGAIVLQSLQKHGFTVTQWLLPNGEQAKQLSVIEEGLQLLSGERFDRGDAVIALGGGVTGDVAGFIAAIYLRGVRFIYAPTTLLAQIDSSVGGKTGVNLPAGKNLVGAFHHPAGVLTDITTLQTLPRREVVAGFCECVKQGAVGKRSLFDQTYNFLERLRSDTELLNSKEMLSLVRAHCAFKASIVEADERENHSRGDRRSRRILNFGHTVGHAIEVTTGYRKFKHGEAVGLGMLVAGELSKNLGLLPELELELLREAIRLCGPTPDPRGLDPASLIEAIKLDKKRRRGDIQWILLERIGRPQIVSGEVIEPKLLRQSLKTALGPFKK